MRPAAAPVEWGVHVLRPITVEGAQALACVGVDRITVHLPWRWLEGKRHRWEWAGLEHFLSPLRESGVPLQGILGPSMPHLMPAWVQDQGGVDAPDYVEWFTDYCRRTVEHLSWISVFRVEDEINSAWGRERLRTRRRRGRAWGRSSFRRRLLAAGVGAVRDQRPEAEVRLTLRLDHGSWNRELMGWWKTKISFDRLGLCLPSPALRPRTDMGTQVDEVVREVRAILGSSPRPIHPPIELSRVGFPTHRQSFSPRHQRLFLAGIGAAVGRCDLQGLHWGALRDQAHDDPLLGYWSPADERHLGLQYYDGMPKPALDELRALATGDRFGGGAGT